MKQLSETAGCGHCGLLQVEAIVSNSRITGFIFIGYICFFCVYREKECVCKENYVC